MLKRDFNFIRKKALCGAVLCTVLMCGCGSSGNAPVQTQNRTQTQSQADVQNQAQTQGQNQLQAQTQGQTQKGLEQTSQTAPPQNRTMGVCGIYIYNEEKGRREFVEDLYESKWESGKDIMCFEVINTHEETIPGKVFKYLWEPIWFATEEASHYRIGYCIDFTLNNKESGGKTKVHKMILEPDDTLEYKEYMEFYLYDDYHQTPGVWYSHVEQSQYGDDTLLTSIKFTAGKNVAAIDGEVTLTAFMYDPEAKQFDASGDFTGSSKQTITVKNIG